MEQEIRRGRLSTGREWHLICSRKPDRRLKEGKHWILEGVCQPTYPDLTPEELKELRLLAFDIAEKEASEPGRYRVDVNGPRAGRREHFHAHIKLPAGQDELEPLVGKEEQDSGEIAQGFCRDAALTQYTELSQDWRLHANDKWKYLFTIFVFHAGVYSFLYSFLDSSKVSLNMHPYFKLIVFLGLIIVIAGMVHSALKSQFYAIRTRKMKEKIAKHPITEMPFAKVEFTEKWKRWIFFPKSMLVFVLITIGFLVLFDIFFFYWR